MCTAILLHYWYSFARLFGYWHVILTKLEHFLYIWAAFQRESKLRIRTFLAPSRKCPWHLWPLVSGGSSPELNPQCSLSIGRWQKRKINKKWTLNFQRAAFEQGLGCLHPSSPLSSPLSLAFPPSPHCGCLTRGTGRPGDLRFWQLVFIFFSSKFNQFHQNHNNNIYFLQPLSRTGDPGETGNDHHCSTKHPQVDYNCPSELLLWASL